MPACKYPQRRNSKTGRCKKPCKKSQKVSKSTGRCVSKSKPARRRRKTYKRKRTTRRKPAYYDTYIPGFDDIEFDTDDEFFDLPPVNIVTLETETKPELEDEESFEMAQDTERPVRRIAIDNTDNVLEKSRQEAIDKIKQAEEDRVDDLLFKDAREEEENIEYFDAKEFADTTLNEQAKSILKGISSGAYGENKNVMGIFWVRDNYNCKPESEVKLDFSKTRSKDQINSSCGIIKLRVVGEDIRGDDHDIPPEWFKQVSDRNSQYIYFTTMIGQEFNSKAMEFVIDESQRNSEKLFDTVFLLENHFWRIQAEGKMNIYDDDEMARLMKKFDEILSERNSDSISRFVSNVFRSNVSVNRYDYP